MKIEVCIEGVHEIVQSEIKEVVAILKLDLKNRLNNTGISFFHNNKAKDVAELRKHIKAMELVLKYYGG